MRCDVYPSKQQALILLAILLAVGAALFAFRQRMPAVVQIGLGTLICAGVAGQIHGLIFNKPAFSVDEAGIHYLPRWFPLIEWRDVVSAERLPKVEQLSDGETLEHEDSRRPIHVLVRNREHYMARVPKFMRSQMFLDTDLDCMKIPLIFKGLCGESERVYDCIQHYLHRPGTKL